METTPTTEIISKGASTGTAVIKVKKGIGFYLTLGIRGLLGSKKGSFALLVLTVTTVALFASKISGEAFVAALSVIAGIYSFSSAAVDMKNGGA